MTDQSAVDALRAALVLLDAHSLIDPEDGNYRVEGGTWEAVRAALAASATDEGPLPPQPRPPADPSSGRRRDQARPAAPALDATLLAREYAALSEPSDD